MTTSTPTPKPSQPTLTKFAVGDLVQAKLTGITGTVTKVGRKYLTVEYDDILHTWQASTTRKVDQS
jgi:preprotein translocase subunit YajC